MFDIFSIPIFRKALASVVIAALLSLQLGSLTGAPLFTAIQDPPLEVAFTANDDDVEIYYLLKTEPELSCSLEFAAAEEPRPQFDRLQSPAQSALDVLSLKEISSRIFIPPRIIS